MVYCGKPSRGCQMCRTRRIKVCSLFIAGLFYSTFTNCCLRSATRPSRHVYNAKNRDALVQDTRTTSTLSSGMRLKPPRGEPGRPTLERKSTQRLRLQALIHPFLLRQSSSSRMDRRLSAHQVRIQTRLWDLGSCPPSLYPWINRLHVTLCRIMSLRRAMLREVISTSLCQC
jgi:hypothetical protein